MCIVFIFISLRKQSLQRGAGAADLFGTWSCRRSTAAGARCRAEGAAARTARRRPQAIAAAAAAVAAAMPAPRKVYYPPPATSPALNGCPVLVHGLAAPGTAPSAAAPPRAQTGGGGRSQPAPPSPARGVRDRRRRLAGEREETADCGRHWREPSLNNDHH